MKITDIKTGHENAIQIPNSCAELRKQIAELNKSGHDCIINVGFGYFRPNMDDKKDVGYLDHYLARELHRAREIQYKRMQMKKAIGRENIYVD